MEACEVVRLFVNRAVVPAEPRRRGNPGYGRLKALRALVYSRKEKNSEGEALLSSLLRLRVSLDFFSGSCILKR